LDEFVSKLEKLNKPIIHKSDLQKLIEAEQIEAEKLSMPDYKFASNDEMLTVMGFKNPLTG
jgi:hypothetical protein